MRALCLVTRRYISLGTHYIQRRRLLTLAIETSCDDTSVAVLEKHRNHGATLHFHAKITSDNRSYGGVYPIVAHESHQRNVASLVNEALRSLPIRRESDNSLDNSIIVRDGNNAVSLRAKPDFVTVTQGPGMRASLITGVDTAKGLAVAWQVPILGVNHMQAHALTPRMVSALEGGPQGINTTKGDPEFPFLSLLVSGGHTMLVQSRSLCDHEILANTVDIAIGDAIDKCARSILPQDVIEASEDVMYGRLLESFAWPTNVPQSYVYVPFLTTKKSRKTLDKNFGWSITPPLQQPSIEAHRSAFSFSGIASTVDRIMTRQPDMGIIERRALALETMRISFEHLAKRVLDGLQKSSSNVKTLVMSGGVASNQFLKHLLRAVLDENGHEDIRLVLPPPIFCTDNAAMIAWTGVEMWEAGWRSELDFLAVRKWPIAENELGGGILPIGAYKQASQ